MAVYTQVDTDQLNEFLQGYNIGLATSLKGLVEGVENTNYFLSTEQGDFILTLYEQRVNPDDLPFFMNLLNHLGQKGIPCPPPVKNRNGESLAVLAGRPAALFPFLRGVSTTSPTTQQCRNVGEELAKLHLAGADLARPWPKNNMGLESWHTLFADIRNSTEDIATGLEGDIEKVLKEAQDNWPTDLPSGICHADLFTDNILLTGNDITGIIDFYFACEELFIYDLAVTLNAWAISPYGSFYYSNSHALIAGYQKHRPISRAEQDVFVLMMRASALRFLLTRLYDWVNTPADAVVQRKDPMEYVRALRLHLNQNSPSFYGFD